MNSPLGGCWATFREKNLYSALAAEFLGVMLFQLLGGSLIQEEARVPDWTDPSTVSTLAAGNGIIFASLVYLTRHVSGGHLNPSITLSVAASGHMHWFRGFLYIVVQMLGGLAGAITSHLFFARGTYCHSLQGDTVIGGWELFSWELIMTFVLIMSVYAAVVPPGHGDMGPLAIGMTLTGLLWAGMPHSGGALNPARVVSPVLINNFYLKEDTKCDSKIIGYYLAAHLAAGAIAALAAMVVHGIGRHKIISRPLAVPEQLLARDPERQD